MPCNGRIELDTARAARRRGRPDAARARAAGAQAQRVLVDAYKRLRAEDAAPGSASSYRITVRQLEALVRLSEALARLRCSETITPANVREVRAQPGGRCRHAGRAPQSCAALSPEPVGPGLVGGPGER